MSAPEVLMADGAIKRQGDNLAPQGVVCRVRQGSDNAAAAGYNAPVPFGLKEFDPFNWFDSAGGTYRFQPKIAGYYRCTSCVVVNGVTATAEVDLYLRKNGSGSAVGTFAGDVTPSTPGGWAAPKATGLVYLNGTTDFVDVQLWVPSAGLMRGTSAQYPYFEAELIGVTAGVIPDQLHLVGAGGEPALNSGVNYGINYAPVSFWKEGATVHLQGLFGNTIAGATLFTLPVGYRPGAIVIMRIASNISGGINRVDINPIGQVSIESAVPAPSAGWCSLTGVAFRAEN